MLLPKAFALAALLVASSLPLGAALLETDAPAAFSHATAVYRVDLSWPTAAQSLAEGGRVFGGTVEHAGHRAAFAQRLDVGDVFHAAAQADRFLVLAERSTDAAGDPVLRLLVTRTAGAADVPELAGRVTLTFRPDAILHDYELHLPNGVAAPSVYSTTTLAWDHAYAAAGSVDSGGNVTLDDGASLDPYGAWGALGTYGVFQQDAGALVGHGRLRQGDMVNYLDEGSFRVMPTATTVRTVFTGFLDAPTAGFGQALLAQDAIVFAGDVPTYAARLGDLAAASPRVPAPLFDPASVDVPTPTGPIPHVLVGVPDSGINPYHEIYYRPNLTVHPCTYVPGFPCSIPALPLSVGTHDSWEEAYAADAALWSGIKMRTWYWIPRTAFVAVMCEGSTSISSGPGRCLIDDTSMHGTGTTSSILTENPNALIAFKEGNAGTGVFEDGTLPIDVLSYSWGAAVPLALAGVASTPRDYAPFYVAASGNEGAFPVVLDSLKASQAVITVGGADAATRTEPGYSGWKTADFVSQYCRPTAQTRAIREWRESYCGTSFAAPTLAGALSKIILDVRRESGYTGSIVDGMVDPVLGVSKWDVRDALNRTATYAPEARFPARPGAAPLVEAAPWYQWGWGYVDATTADAAVACILRDACPAKGAGAEAFMGALWTFRGAYGGWTAFDAYDCHLRDHDPACRRLPGA